MKYPERIPGVEEAKLSANEIRKMVGSMYTETSENVQEQGDTLIRIFAKELKEEFPLADIEASPYWHAMVISGEKKLDYVPNTSNLEVIAAKIQKFILEKIKPLVTSETETYSSDLLARIKDLKERIVNLGDRGLGEAYQSVVNDLVLQLQKETPISLTRIPEIDAVLGGSGNYESLRSLDEDMVETVTEKFKSRYEPIHERFSAYLEGK